MATINRKSSYVLKLDNEVKCCICGHRIKYSSKTYFDQTSNHIGLDCWEKEKESRKVARLANREARLAIIREKDSKSNFIGSMSDKISIQARLEKVIYLYSGNYGSIYLNIFRTANGDLISYKGKPMIEDVASVLFSDILKKLCSYFEFDFSINKKQVYSIMSETDNLLLSKDVEMSTIIGYKELLSFFNDMEYYNDQNVDIKDLTEVENNQYITLTGTIKELTVYNDIKQTLIERPKIK